MRLWLELTSTSRTVTPPMIAVLESEPLAIGLGKRRVVSVVEKAVRRSWLSA
jgi:hypothetical protein